MVLAIAASLQGVDRRLEESARILGAGAVSEPSFASPCRSALDGVGTGFILVFMLANGSFVTLLLLGGGWQTLPLLIFQQISTSRATSPSPRHEQGAAGRRGALPVRAASTDPPPGGVPMSRR